jgi:hypothetical protein
MKIIRFGVFETNSSNTHSLTIVPKTTFEAFKNGEISWYRDDGILVEDPDFFEKKYKEEEYQWYDSLEDYIEQTKIENYTEWKKHYLDCYDSIYEEFTTPSSDEMVVFGYYGNDNC